MNQKIPLRTVTLSKITTRKTYMILFALMPKYLLESFIKPTWLEKKHYYRGSDGELYTFTELNKNFISGISGNYTTELDKKTIEIFSESVVNHVHYNLSPERYPVEFEVAE